MSAPHFAWAVLQLAPTTDEREIKRAYARLAKVHRAEEDAEAFQQLRAAYETALELAAASDAAPTVQVLPPNVTPLRTQRRAQQNAEHARVRQHAQALVAGFTAQTAAASAVAVITQWLAHHPLEGLEDKAWFEIGLMQAMTAPALPLSLIDAVADQFNWNGLGHLTRLDPASVALFVQHVRALRHAESERIYEAQLRDFAAGKTAHGPEARYARLAAAALLQQPWQPLRSRALSLLPVIQDNARGMLREIEQAHPALAARLDPQACAFWRVRRFNLTARPLYLLAILGALCGARIAYGLMHSTWLGAADKFVPVLVGLSVLGGLVSASLLLLALCWVTQIAWPCVLRQLTPRSMPTLLKPDVIEALPGFALWTVGIGLASRVLGHDVYQDAIHHAYGKAPWCAVTLFVAIALPIYAIRIGDLIQRVRRRNTKR